MTLTSAAWNLLDCHVTKKGTVSIGLGWVGEGLGHSLESRVSPYETGGIGLIPLVGTVNGLPGSPSWPAEPFILD